MSKSSKSAADALPVSRKFYDTLMIRVDEIVTAVFGDHAEEFADEARCMIDRYLTGKYDATCEQEATPEIRIIFLTLKTEIDRARQRSLRARAAARRRAKVKKSNEATPTSTEVTSGPDEPQVATVSQDTAPALPHRKQQAARSFRTALRWRAASPYVSNREGRRGQQRKLEKKRQ